MGCEFSPIQNKTSAHGPLQALEALLNEWHKDILNKVLIFTKSVRLLEMLEFHLNSKRFGFLKLDGSTKQADREFPPFYRQGVHEQSKGMPMIDKFNKDPSVYIFLISTALKNQETWQRLAS